MSCSLYGSTLCRDWEHTWEGAGMASWAGQPGGTGFQSTVREYPKGIGSCSVLGSQEGRMTALMPLDGYSSSSWGGRWLGEGG